MSAQDTGGGTLPFGPIQMLVVEFDRTKFDGEIMPEFDRLKRAGLIRLVDLLFVTKNEDGELDVLKTTDLNTDEAMEFGAIIGALVGLGMGGEEGAEAGAIVGAEAGADGHVIDESEAWYLDERIPPGSSAAVVAHRAPLGDPAQGQDGRRGRRGARRRMDPSGRPRRARARRGTERDRGRQDVAPSAEARACRPRLGSVRTDDDADQPAGVRGAAGLEPGPPADPAVARPPRLDRLGGRVARRGDDRSGCVGGELRRRARGCARDRDPQRAAPADRRGASPAVHGAARLPAGDRARRAHAARRGPAHRRRPDHRLVLGGARRGDRRFGGQLSCSTYSSGRTTTTRTRCA